MEGFVHGPLACERCFDASTIVRVEGEGFRLTNGPGYWGAQDPLILVLGQTRGARQRSKDDFDQIAFAGIRDRLLNILSAIGIENLSMGDPDAHFRKEELVLGFASVLRCSLSFEGGKTSGSPLTAGIGATAVSECVDRCMDRWLKELNPGLRLVVMLGLTKKYRNAIFSKIRKLYPDGTESLNEDALRANNVVWVVAQHPSTISENHYQSWISEEPHRRRDGTRRIVSDCLRGA